MNKEIKQKWVNALRSGNYIQIKYQLKDKFNRFCVLGVLVDIYNKEHVIPTITDEHYYSPDIYKALKWAGLDEIPTLTISKWFGLFKKERNLMSLNDTYGMPFKQLADLIEKQL